MSFNHFIESGCMPKGGISFKLNSTLIFFKSDKATDEPVKKLVLTTHELPDETSWMERPNLFFKTESSSLMALKENVRLCESGLFTLCAAKNSLFFPENPLSFAPLDVDTKKTEIGFFEMILHVALSYSKL